MRTFVPSAAIQRGARCRYGKGEHDPRPATETLPPERWASPQSSGKGSRPLRNCQGPLGPRRNRSPPTERAAHSEPPLRQSTPASSERPRRCQGRTSRPQRRSCGVTRDAVNAPLISTGHGPSEVRETAVLALAATLYFGRRVIVAGAMAVVLAASRRSRIVRRNLDCQPLRHRRRGRRMYRRRCVLLVRSQRTSGLNRSSRIATAYPAENKLERQDYAHHHRDDDRRDSGRGKIEGIEP